MMVVWSILIISYPFGILSGQLKLVDTPHSPAAKQDESYDAPQRAKPVAKM